MNGYSVGDRYYPRTLLSSNEMKRNENWLPKSKKKMMINMMIQGGKNEINLKCPKQEMKKKKENFNLKTFVWHLPERRASTCTVIDVKNINAVAAIIIR